MALVINDRVRETSTTTGTVTFTLLGALTGFESFSTAIGNTNTTYYAISNQANGEFEVGLGTVGAGTLARTTVISSSNSDALVNFSAGTKDVFCTLPASKAVILDSSDNIVANNGSNLTALNATQLTSGTVPDARFPATLPAANGSALTDLNATNLASGTVPDARFPATLPAANGSALTNLNATALTTGTVANARLDAQLQDVAGLATTAGKIIQGDGSNFALSAYTLPTSDGSAAQVLTTDGLGAVTFATPTVGDITAVTAGTNLTGGGSSGDVTLNLADASTSVKGAASFSSDNFAASSGAITIKDLGIATAEIQDDAITLAKMAPGTDGNIISYDTSGNPVAVATGTSGQVLTSAGAGAVPSFQTPTVGDITAVTAGTGLTGGGTTGDVTLNVIGGTGITANANDIQIDSTVATLTGSQTLTNKSINASQLTGTITPSDNTVTLAKMAPGTDGNIISYDTSGNPVAVATGSSGQVLTSAGAGAVPSFQTPTVGDITAVTAGSGLTGGGSSGDVTLNVGAGNLIDVTADAIDVDLSELTTSTSNTDGDFFVVVDSANAQKKLTKGNINNSGFNNDAGYTTNTGDITGVTAGTNLTGGGTAGTVTLNMATGGVGSGTYGSTANATKIDTITVDAYGRVTAVATGATGDIDGVTAGNGLTGGGTSGTPTLNVGAGTGIDVSADAIAVDVSDFMSNGSNDRVVTATGTDAMNAESNLVFTGSRLGINEASPERALTAKSSELTVMHLESTGGAACLSNWDNTGVTSSSPRFGSFGQTLWQFNLAGSEVARIISPASFSIGTTGSSKTINAEGSTGEIGLNSTSSGFSRVAHIHNGTTIWTTGTRTGSDYYIFRESGSGKVDINSNLTVSGSVSKGSGSFKIDHPLENKKDTHNLVHSFVEAPQADNIYRGKVDLVNGSATINIDTNSGMSEGTFVLLNTNIQCFTSNETEWTAVKGLVAGNILTITAQDNTCTDTISWMVIGERQDQHMIDTEWTDENGKVIVEPLKKIKENN